MLRIGGLGYHTWSTDSLGQHKYGQHSLPQRNLSHFTIAP